MPETFTISPGTVFTHAQDPQMHYIVTNVIEPRPGPAPYFSAGLLNHDQNSQPWFWDTGTSFKEQIGQIVNQLTPEEFLAALQLGAIISGFDSLPDTIRAYYNDYITQEPRQI